MRRSALLVLGIACAASTPNTTSAQSVIDPNASVVELRSPASPACPTCTGCENTSGNFLDNCFETTADLTDWIWGTGAGARTNPPTSVDRVTVHVGPGTFDRFACLGSLEGWVSLIGSGREHTRFAPANPEVPDPDFPGLCVGGVDVDGCTGMNFQDLTVEGVTRAVNWRGSGTSTWSDVDITADSDSLPAGQGCMNEGFPPPTYAWWDRVAWGTTGGPHYFFNTRFVVRDIPLGPGYAHATFASDFPSTEHWFYGCDILLDKTGADHASLVDAALWSAGPVFVFGSTIRVRTPDGMTNAALFPAMGVFTTGTFHMHGGIINVNVAAQDQDVVGIRNGGGGLVHTPETAFNLRESVSGGGTTWRIQNTGAGSIMSPFQWPASTSPPDLLSEQGQDTFVKTDAGPGQNEARLYIYDNSCGSLWRDTIGSCL